MRSGTGVRSASGIVTAFASRGASPRSACVLAFFRSSSACRRARSSGSGVAQARRFGSGSGALRPVARKPGDGAALASVVAGASSSRTASGLRTGVCSRPTGRAPRFCCRQDGVRFERGRSGRRAFFVDGSCSLRASPQQTMRPPSVRCRNRNAANGARAHRTSASGPRLTPQLRRELAGKPCRSGTVAADRLCRPDSGRRRPEPARRYLATARIGPANRPRGRSRAEVVAGGPERRPVAGESAVGAELAVRPTIQVNREPGRGIPLLPGGIARRHDSAGKLRHRDRARRPGDERLSSEPEIEQGNHGRNARRTYRHDRGSVTQEQRLDDTCA